MRNPDFHRDLRRALLLLAGFTAVGIVVTAAFWAPVLNRCGVL